MRRKSLDQGNSTDDTDALVHGREVLDLLADDDHELVAGSIRCIRTWPFLRRKEKCEKQQEIKDGREKSNLIRETTEELVDFADLGLTERLEIVEDAVDESLVLLQQIERKSTEHIDRLVDLSGLQKSVSFHKHLL